MKEEKVKIIKGDKISEVKVIQGEKLPNLDLTKKQLSKKKYNQKKSIIQVDKKIHQKIKEYCIINNIKVTKFIESVLVDFFRKLEK